MQCSPLVELGERERKQLLLEDTTIVNDTPSIHLSKIYFEIWNFIYARIVCGFLLEKIKSSLQRLSAE
jgi:hypothetical protein